ncbi:MAG: type II toxin-antitoxin system ParD family antitoxin [Hyphomonadaceae bacterium]|nr:type II toxin-antitoxin system ParD family antitoxin [Hyphomonadaceae bacterium]
MRSTKQLSVTLPNAMAEEVAAKVASGEYASESEVLRDGLRALRARDKAIERWLGGEVSEIYDAMTADPARARSAGDVRASLARAHKRASKHA